MALTAPGLPLPWVRRSTAPPLARRAARSADGIVPTRYPATAEATGARREANGREAYVGRAGQRHGDGMGGP